MTFIVVNSCGSAIELVRLALGMLIWTPMDHAIRRTPDPRHIGIGVVHHKCEKRLEGLIDLG